MADSLLGGDGGSTTDQTTDTKTTTDTTTTTGAVSSLTVPAKDAPVEQWNSFYTSLGRPEKADGYKVEGVTLSDDPSEQAIQTAIRQAAWDAGITQSQYAKLATTLSKLAEEQGNAAAAEIEMAPDEALKVLGKAWGAATNERLGAVNKFISDKFDAETMQEIIDSGMANNPKFIMGLWKAVEAAGEDKLGPVNGRGGTMTPDMAQRALDQLGLDAEHQKAKWDANHPGHSAAVRREAELYEAMSGEAGQLTKFVDDITANRVPNIQISTGPAI